MLRGTAACISPTSQLPKVLRQWRAFSILTSKSASDHNGCNFSSRFSPDAPVAFASLLFSPREPENIGIAAFRDFYIPFGAHWSSFFWLFLFWLFLFSASAHLCLSVHIVGSLTSKLPSVRLHFGASACRFAKMILRDRWSTSYDLASLFRGRRSTLDRWSGKNHNTHWYAAVSSALNFPFLKKASQNRFLFDVLNFEHWGSLAGLFRFWCCQLWKWRKSRRISSVWSCDLPFFEEASQHCFVLDLSTSRFERILLSQLPSQKLRKSTILPFSWVVNQHIATIIGAIREI